MSPVSRAATKRQFLPHKLSHKVKVPLRQEKPPKLFPPHSTLTRVLRTLYLYIKQRALAPPYITLLVQRQAMTSVVRRHGRKLNVLDPHVVSHFPCISNTLQIF